MSPATYLLEKIRFGEISPRWPLTNARRRLPIALSNVANAEPRVYDKVAGNKIESNLQQYYKEVSKWK